jgi:UDP-N-acetyl-D-galactosamine dehydrogenase
MEHRRRIAVIGLGYVGLPVAVAFARDSGPVIGFDVNAERIAELQAGQDRTREIETGEFSGLNIIFTTNVEKLSVADFFIVTVPTPIDDSNRPDLSALRSASETVGRAMKPGSIVVYESTVYPGATEEVCLPILEKASGLLAGREFTVGYSPERINPGDREHRFEKIQKVVSGQDANTLAIVSKVYGSVVKAGIYEAPSIKVAEAAKVIENTQRDLNIALMNELSAICHALGIDTSDVLTAAGTKWNFLPFVPGLVGGHCIGVDPYYLTFRAEKAGYHPQVILAGRRINDDVGARIARECLRLMLKSGNRPERVTILGLTFKENVPDIRNSKVVDIARELDLFGIDVQIHDPLAIPAEAEQEYGLTLKKQDALLPADAVILAVPHDTYLEVGWPLVSGLLKGGCGVVMDVKSKLPRSAQPKDVAHWRL